MFQRHKFLRMKFKNRLVIYLLLLSFVAVLLTAGCKVKTEVGQVVPKELIIGLEKNPETMDILKASEASWHPSHQMYETLVVPDYHMKPRPLLAESWERVDEVTWKFHLRKGVKFHDGTPFDAQAVKYSLERLQKEGPKWAALLVKTVKTIKVEDDYTILIVTETPFSPLVESLMVPCAAMVSPTAVEKYKAEFAKNPCGTGPFKLEEFIPEQRVVLVRNEDYWGNKPKLKKVICKTIADPSTRLMALQAGSVDVIRDLPLAEISMLEADQRFKVLKTLGTRTTYYGFNTDREYFKDIRLRKAFNYAINKEAIVTHVLHGIGQPAKGFVTPSIPGYLDLESYPYNPEKAKQLLAETGWKDSNGDGILDKNGKPFKISLFVSSFTAQIKPVAETVQAQLREVGIELEIKTVEWGALTDVVMKRNFDLVCDASPARCGGADYQLMSRFHSTYNPSIHARTGYANKRVDELLELARREVDESKRMKIYHEVQEIINQEAAVIPLFYEMEVVAVKAHVKGFKPHPAIWPVDLTEVDIEGQ